MRGFFKLYYRIEIQRVTIHFSKSMTSSTIRAKKFNLSKLDIHFLFNC